MGLRGVAAARRQLRGAPARRAHLVRLGAARPAALRHRAAAARRRRSRRCDLPCHSRSRIVAVKGLRPGEGTGYGLRWTRRRAADDRDRAGRLRRRPRHAPRRPRRACSSAAAACRSSASVCMDMITIDVTGTRRLAGRRGRAHRPPGRRRDHRARNRGGDRDDSVGSRVPAGREDRATIRSTSKFEVRSSNSRVRVRSTTAAELQVRRYPSLLSLRRDVRIATSSSASRAGARARARASSVAR